VDVLHEVLRCGIVPVIVLDDAQDAAPVATALRAGGITVMEVTFRTDAAEQAIANVASQVPDMLIGAGTVLNVGQMERAVGAGAKFIVSPGSNEELIRHAVASGIPIFPGVVTPSEIMMGLKHGLEIFKFFPAELSGGLKAIKALSPVFPNIKFIPTGGINEENMRDYLENPSTAAIGGSWMATSKMIKNGEYEKITRKSADAVDILNSVRKEV